MEKQNPYCKTQPCQNCPYRTDAPLAYWHKEEFEKLLESEQDYMGRVYQCHKKDGNVCIGWLINQDKRRFPSIALRISLSKNGITREYLDKLHCNSSMYETVEEMIQANFPELLKKQ